MPTPSTWVWHDDDDAAGIDDDDLEELHELLWRGYVPAPHERMEWDAGTGGDGQWHPWVSPKELEKARQERAELYARYARGSQERQEPRYEEFQCDRCKRWCLSPIDDTDEVAEYIATFGEPPKDDSLTLCEPCFDIMLKERMQ
jgi:hypothetical protein